MEQIACAGSGVAYVGLEEKKSIISTIEQASLELRLAEMEIFRDIVKSLKKKKKGFRNGCDTFWRSGNCGNFILPVNSLSFFALSVDIFVSDRKKNNTKILFAA